MRRTLNIRLDAACREHRGGLARHEVELGEDGLPRPIVVHGRVYTYAGEETAPDGTALWAIFAEAGPAGQLAA